MNHLAYRNVLPQIGNDVFIAPGAGVIGDVIIGERSSIWFNTVVRGDVNYIRIGSHTSVQDNSTLHVTAPRFPLLIGDRVVIGHKALVHGCVIEDESLIGMGAIILDGCKIGGGSIVAAGALLPPGFEVPPGSLVMGAPAKIRRKVDDSDQELIRRSWSHYSEMAFEYFKSGSAIAGEVKGFLK